MTAIKETNGDTHTYRPNRAYAQAGQLLGGGFASVTLLMYGAAIISNVRTTGQRPTFEDFVPLLFLGVILALAMRPSAETPYRLVTSPRGIAFHRPGLSVESSWENLKEIRMTYKPVLVLHHSAATKRSWL